MQGSMPTRRSPSLPAQRTTSHRLVVLQPLAAAQFDQLARLCGADPRDRLKTWADSFTFHPRPDAFAAACAYAAAEGLHFRTETTITVSYLPDARAIDREPLASADEGDAFSIDGDRLHAWIAAEANERGISVDGADVRYDDVHGGALHEALADDIRDLTDAGILQQPPDWNVHVLPLYHAEQRAFVVTVAPSDDANDEAVPTFLLAAVVDEVRSTRGVSQHIEDVVDTANNLLVVARAARIGTDPHATHHPDGMCKAHGDYDCGEDDCRR